MNKIEEDNRNRCLSIVEKIPVIIPQKWEQTAHFAIGGLLSVGFSKNEHFLLVLSSEGRGVFDCFTGEKVARDNEKDGDWYKSAELKCEGIGPIENETINMAGMDGGGLRSGNDEGDHLHLISPFWPKQDILFCSNWKHYLSDNTFENCFRIWSGYEPRAYGFSPSGMTFAVADSAELYIYTIK